jgi:phosphate:Na+ symporter
MGDREAVATARRSDDVLDRLNGEIKRYLTRLDPESLTDDEHLRMEAVLAFSLNLEGAGDVVERNIASFVGKLLKRGFHLTPTDDRTISEAFDAIRANLRSAASILMTGDRRAARVLSQQKAEFRRREAEAIRSHFARLRDRHDASVPEATPLDLLRDIKRLNDHIVAGAAYPVLEAAGDLMQSRIAHDGDDEPV